MTVEAGIGRSGGINHSEIGLELEDRIIPGLNYRVNNTRVKFEPWCFCDWRIATVRASLSCSTLPKWINSMGQFGQRPPGGSASSVSQCVRAVLSTPLCPTKPMCGLQRHETGQIRKSTASSERTGNAVPPVREPKRIFPEQFHVAIDAPGQRGTWDARAAIR